MFKPYAVSPYQTFKISFVNRVFRCKIVESFGGYEFAGFTKQRLATVDIVMISLEVSVSVGVGCL